MTIETARRASLEFVCVFGQDGSTFESRGRFTERPEHGELLPKSDNLESQLATSSTRLL